MADQGLSPRKPVPAWGRAAPFLFALALAGCASPRTQPDPLTYPGAKPAASSAKPGDPVRTYLTDDGLPPVIQYYRKALGSDPVAKTDSVAVFRATLAQTGPVVVTATREAGRQETTIVVSVGEGRTKAPSR